MKTMGCDELGGACEKEFSVDTFEEIAELSLQHEMEMAKKNNQDHLKVMEEIKQLIKTLLKCRPGCKRKRKVR